MPSTDPTAHACRSPLFAIGDLQGCHDSLARLLQSIQQECSTANDNTAAQLMFVGDLINRGPHSLATLRQVRDLCEAGVARAILGNHDLHLLAVAAGVRKIGKLDTLQEILDAPDAAELVDWVRQQPLARLQNLPTTSSTSAPFLFVHAGALPQWTAAQVIALSAEVEAVLRGPDWMSFMSSMYGNTPCQWQEQLKGTDRLRCIVNGLTRLRLCDSMGNMDFDVKESSQQAPPGLMPWYAVPDRRTQDVTVVFGHWSAQGLVQENRIIGLDTGCVWGGKLTAMRLADRHLVQVNCPQIQKPGK